jgi:hypothetical protein
VGNGWSSLGISRNVNVGVDWTSGDMPQQLFDVFQGAGAVEVEVELMLIILEVE